MAYIEEIKASVEKGAQLLDQKKPGWYLKIDIARLEMETCRRCVLGQLYGEYDVGLAHLHLPYNDYDPGLQFGFSLLDPTDSHIASITDPRWNTLRSLWIEQITKRQEATQ